MGLTFTESISAVTVFIQGVLSFFSPCVLPLLPLYIGYLSGGTGAGAYAGKGGFDRRKVILNTLCFVAGIGFSFLLLGLGMRAVGLFFSGNQLLFARAGGIIVILFGLYQTGIFGYSSFLAGEKRLPARFDKMAMSPFTALLMGFVFSFAWTPCVGPALSGVLLMAASAKDSAAGFALVGVYTLGFSLPFLLTGIFTTSILNIFRQHKNVVRYTTRISGVLLILMGILMITGSMNNFTQYLSQISGTEEKAVEEGPEPSTETEISEPDDTAEEYSEDIAGEYTEDIAEGYTEDIAEEYTEASGEAGGDEPADEESANEEPANEEPDNDESDNDEPADEEEAYEPLPAPDFTLTDQYGKTHTLSDYKGKTVFLNFWATWCPPCREEMPYIQEIYEETQADGDSDLVILAVAFPNLGKEMDEDGVKDFLEENGYTYPTVFDTEASLLAPYYITAYPTTYMIDRNGNIYGYAPGSMTKEIMEDIIRQTREAE